MNNNRIYISMIVLLVALFMGITSVFADCSTCDVSNCAACGCVKTGNVCTYSNFQEGTVSCGSGVRKLTNIPKTIPQVTSIVYIIIQIVVPIILVVIGMFDLVKSITSQKEDDMKKARQTLIKRVIAAVLVFFIFAVVKFVVSLVADNGGSIMDCAECFIKGNCKTN